LVYAASLGIDGAVGGDVLGQMDQLKINAPVAGGVDVKVVSFALEDGASIAGNVEYTSNNLVTQAFNASIGGDTVRNDPLYIGNPKHVQTIVLLFVMVLLSSFVWYFLSRKTITVVTERTLTRPSRCALVGVGTFFAMPVVITVLTISYLGVFVAAVGLFGYITLLLLTFAAVPAVVGQLLMRVFNQPQTTLTPLVLAIGSIACCAVLFVPFVGLLILCIVAIVVLGGLVESLIKANS
jgi:hypothetical protein